ncbi:MAG: OmpA family protein [Candidatus Acidiferrum sp.]|jgi:OOP family OmpA-OmpF porin
MPDDPIYRLPLDPDEEISSGDINSFEQLRHLILAPEQQDLARLRERLEDPGLRTGDISAVLPEAIHLRRQEGGEDALGQALLPTVESALRESVRKDPGTLADALFPVMGPAIRRSILQTLRSFFDSFNEAMEHSLSLRGLQWRIEALRTGRSFSEIVLLHSLVFRVEQVFLIHKKTGLPLAHAVAPAVAMQDASLVSGMLSAIQDFVRDSFQSARGQILEKIDVGEMEVWVEDGPYAILASVIRGIPPPDYRLHMAEALEHVHRNFAEQMERFQGETGPFAGANEELSRCLEFQYKEQQSRRPKSYVLALAIVLVLLVAGWSSYRGWQDHRWGQFVETLRAQPGIVVTGFARQHGHYVIRGLRDPLSADPQSLLKQTGLDASQAEVRLGGYYALDDAIVQKRAAVLLQTPPGVEMTVSDGVLHAEGQAPASWAGALRNRALLLPGIREVDLSQLTDTDQAEFERLQRLVQAAIIRFPLGSSVLTTEETAALQRLSTEIRSLLAQAELLHKTVTVEVVGHSDSTGYEATNWPLSEDRAERVVLEFTRDGVPRSLLRGQGVAASQPLRQEENEGARQYNRSVTFRVKDDATAGARAASRVSSNAPVSHAVAP